MSDETYLGDYRILVGIERTGDGHQFSSWYRVLLPGESTTDRGAGPTGRGPTAYSDDPTAAMEAAFEAGLHAAARYVDAYNRNLHMPWRLETEEMSTATNTYDFAYRDVPTGRTFIVSVLDHDREISRARDLAEQVAGDREAREEARQIHALGFDARLDWDASDDDTVAIWRRE